MVESDPRHVPELACNRLGSVPALGTCSRGQLCVYWRHRERVGAEILLEFRILGRVL